MEGKEKESEKNKLEITKNLINLPIDINNTQYLLKIFPSKDNQSIIFKLSIQNIKTYYYYAKNELNQLKHITEKPQELNISKIFNRIKQKVLDHQCKLEKKGILISIMFIKKNKDISASITLKKKLVNQDKLNDDLFLQIQESEIKRKNLKKQITKLEKAIQSKNDVINNIQNEIINLTEIINNLSTSSKDNDLDINNKLASNSKENDDEIKKTYTITKEENELLKKNLTLNQEKETKEIKENKEKKIQENDLIGKRYISNNRKKKNKPKKNKNNNSQNKKEENKKNSDEGFFCFENDVYKNKKAYESLILFNFIAILVVMYLLCSIYALKSNLTFEKMKDQELMKKVTLLSLLEDSNENDLGGIRENIVDFNLNNDDNNSNEDDNNNNSNNDNNKIKYVKTKRRDSKDIIMLKNEREKKFFKKKIKKKIHFRVKDIVFDLKYNSYEEYRYHNFYNNIRDISEILLLFKTKNNNNRIGFFSNNIIFYQKNFEYKDNIFSGYLYKNDRFYEIEIKEFITNYGEYVQNIINYIKNENTRIKKRSSNITASNSVQLLGEVDLFEIYEVKFQK